VLIIKTGSTYAELAAQRGDFEDWIISGMGIDRNDILIVDVSQNKTLPSYRKLSGIVVTGSHAMVAEHHAWSEYANQWMSGAIERQIPLLGICYGHQLLAYALGGMVGDNPEGLEFGTVNISLTAEAGKDLLFSKVPHDFPAHVCHKQSVLLLPPGAQVLASSDLDEHQAFVFGTYTWGVQFHPEFDTNAMKKYITTYTQELSEQGTNPKLLLEGCRETPESSSLLQRFYEIICEKKTELPAPRMERECIDIF
jgi:GMP synthase (glutamine-hydrolysing)